MPTCPEQANGDGDLTEAVDIYALAACLAYAATGRLLYGPLAGAPLLYRICDRHTLPDLDTVPSSLVPLLGAMLAHDPGARPSLAAVEDRLPTLATSDGATIEELRAGLIRLAAIDPPDVPVPTDLTDPEVEEEDLESEVVEASPPTPPAAPASERRADVDVGWLVERVRHQYDRQTAL